MDLYASKGPALPQKLAITAIEVGLVALSAWLMFGGGEAMVAAAFGFEPAETVPARRGLILAFNVVILIRMAFMMFVLMRRSMPWEEVATVPLAFALYYVGFAVLVLPSHAPIGPWDWLGVALFVAGCVLNTGGELQRHRFKRDSATPASSLPADSSRSRCTSTFSAISSGSPAMQSLPTIHGRS